MNLTEVGWNWLQNATRWHWFGADGRSLCGRWLGVGLTWPQNEPSDRAKCAACKRKVQTWIEESGSG